MLYDISLTILFFALWVGVPIWLAIRHPDIRPQIAHMAAVAYWPAQQDDPGYQRAA